MNETQKRRLVGLIVLLAIVFALSELLPHNLPESGEAGVPSTTLPLAVNGDGSSSGAQAGQGNGDTTAPAESGPAPAANGGAAHAPDASAPALNANAAAPKFNPSAMPPDVSAMPSTAATEVEAEAKPKPSKPAAARPAEAKPAETARFESKPPQPTLRLAQSLPPPSKTPPLAPAAPAKPTPPPPVPPTPRLATSVQAPPPVASSPGRLWFVQIGSFADQGNAQTTLNLLQNIGFRGESKSITSNSGNALYRVRLGPFPSEAVALQALGKVTHQGYPQARVLSEASDH